MTRVAVIAGMRTPFSKINSVLKNYSAVDLAIHSVHGVLEKLSLDPNKIDEMVYGVVINNPKVPQLGREIVLQSDLPNTIPAHTVSNNCITGIQSITDIYRSIVTGCAEVGLAGGTESLSNIPILFNKDLARTFVEINSAKTLMDKAKWLGKIRLSQLKPETPSISEPSTGLTMGEHCEIMAKEWQVDQHAQDEIAYRSHQQAYKATEDGRLKAEIYPLNGIDSDNIIRPHTTMEKLENLKPVFDRSEKGTITAGNSSPLTDGAATVLLASEARAKKEGWKPIAYIKAFEYAAIDPKDGLLMAPCVAVPRLLQKTGLSLDDMGLIEMHEAFGAQVVCNRKAWAQDWKEPAIGEIPLDKLNQLGSSIAVGHPFAATGGRIVTTLANEMQRRDLQYGLISICAAGAMAAAMILERA